MTSPAADNLLDALIAPIRKAVMVSMAMTGRVYTHEDYDKAMHCLSILAGVRARNERLEEALRDELLPLIREAERLAGHKNLAAAEVFRAVSNVSMWLRAVLAEGEAQ